MKYIHVLPVVCFSACFLICLPTLRHRYKRLLHGGSAQHGPGGRRRRPHVCQHGVGSVWGERRARWLLHTVRSHGGRLLQQPGKTEVPDEQAVRSYSECVCAAYATWRHTSADAAWGHRQTRQNSRSTSHQRPILHCRKFAIALTIHFIVANMIYLYAA